MPFAFNNLVFAQAADGQPSAPAPQSVPAAQQPAPPPPVTVIVEPIPASAAGTPAAPAGEAAPDALPVSNSAAPAAAPTVVTHTTIPPKGTEPALARQPGVQDSSLYSFLPLILICVAFWFLLIAPQRKREKEIRKRQSELKNGDQVLTSAGIYGKVVNLDGERVTLQVGEGTRIVFQRQAIAGVLGDQKDDSKKIASK